MAFQGRIRRNLQLMTVFVLVTSGLLDKAAAAPGCPSGLVTILSSYEIQQVQNCETLDGITIKDTIGMKDSLNFPALKYVGASGITIFSDAPSSPSDESGGHSTSGGWEGVLKTLSMPKLERVDGPMVMRNLLALSEVNFGKLSTVDGFGIATAPKLASLSFPSGLTSTGSSFAIVDTGISGTSLSGLQFSQAGTIDVTSNPNLQALSLPNLSQVTGPMKVALNGQSASSQDAAGGGASVDADKLEKVGGDLILNWISAISMRSLSSVSGNLEVTEGSSNMSSIALPKLTEIGRSITVRSNANLSSVRLPALSTVSGNIVISESPSLSSLSPDEFIPSIKKVGGSINISLPGTLQQFSLPTGSSPQIGGNLQVEGSDSMDCDAIKRSAAMANMNLRDAVSCSTTSSMPEFGNSTHRLPATMYGQRTKTLGAAVSSSTSLATSKGTANKPSSSGGAPVFKKTKGNVGYVVLALLSFTLA